MVFIIFSIKIGDFVIYVYFDVKTYLKNVNLWHFQINSNLIKMGYLFSAILHGLLFTFHQICSFPVHRSNLSHLYFSLFLDQWAWKFRCVTNNGLAISCAFLFSSQPLTLNLPCFYFSGFKSTRYGISVPSWPVFAYWPWY